MGTVIIVSAVWGFQYNRRQNRQRAAHLARQRLSVKKKYIYLNNYDDMELDGKIRKVMDADR